MSETKQEWWKRTSAADDAVEGSAARQRKWLDDDWLREFDFDDYRADSASQSIGSFWGRYGVADRTDEAARIAAAQKIVQGFANTFSTGDVAYRVTFSAGVATAGTSFASKAIVVSHRPLFDPTLTDDEAQVVLTRMACHEAYHDRYGRETAAAVRATWPTNHPLHDAAHRLGNLLDDVRIEARGDAEFPGFAYTSAPTLAYVARSTAPNAKAATLSPMNVAVAAVRYAPHVDWTGRENDRDQWIDWSVRGTATDDVDAHVAAVAEGLSILEDQQDAQEQEQTPEPQAAPEPQDADEQDDAETDDADDATDETDDSETDETQSDAGEGTTETDDDDEADADDDTDETDASQSADDEADADETAEGGEQDGEGDQEQAEPKFGECLGDAIGAAAEANGETSSMDEAHAQELVEQANALVDDGLGGKGEVYYTAEGLTSQWGRSSAEPSAPAAAAVRTAFARSRTGHYDKQAGFRTGRIDNRGIVRIAENDYRVFNRRTAPSEGKYTVWLMVDCSGSMGGMPIYDAAAVSSAFAAASRGLPSVRMSIWGWTSGFRLGGSFGAARVWTTGDAISKVNDLTVLGRGGTPDAEMFSWATRAIIDEASLNGSQPVLIVASDGEGSLRSHVDLIAKARRQGITVVSVALGGGVRPDQQRRMYGEGSFVPWLGTIERTARPLGKMVARIVGTKA